MKIENPGQEEVTEGCVSNLSVHQRRELILSEFKRKSRVRTIFRDLSVEELAEILERVQDVLAERVQEEKERAEKEAVIMEKAVSILKDMEAKGVDIKTLKEIQEQRESTSGSKVRYVKDGATWTGQGRRPAPFKGLSDLELEKYRKPVNQDE